LEKITVFINLSINTAVKTVFLAKNKIKSFKKSIRKVTMKKDQLLLGAHMSIAGGFQQAIIKGESIGCTAIQIFTKSSRQWNTKPITLEQSNLFKTTLQESSCVKSVMAHASYLINIGSSDKALAQKSVTALTEELQRCHTLGIPFLVLHPGAHGKATAEESLDLASQNLNYVFEQYTGDTIVLLENTAGQGSSIGSTFEQLHTIYEGTSHKNKVGFCFDTCHAFAAGYDLSTSESYEAIWNHFDKTIGLKNLKAFHLNDSAKGLGSHVDRHAHIGHGKIGLEGFRLLMNDARFFSLPKILETPKAESNLDQDLENLTVLKNLLTQTSRMKLQISEDD
jgi:deoxyribonuclease IV